jgi:DeoR/GlpR family transcriptional regulator of sugar metabolism
LELSNQLVRTHGGAILREDAHSESTLAEKETLNLFEKQKIGQEARKRILDEDTVMLGGGTTTLEIAKRLKDMRGGIVVTNALHIALELYQNPNLEVILLGGHLRRSLLSLVGPHTMKTLEDIYVDKLFLGVDGISTEHGLTTPNPAEAEADRKMTERAKKVFIVADHSKFGRVSFAKMADLDAIDEIITDSSVDPSMVEEIRRRNIEVTVV